MLRCPMSDMITNDQSTGHSGLHLRAEDDDDDDDDNPVRGYTNTDKITRQ